MYQRENDWMQANTAEKQPQRAGAKPNRKQHKEGKRSARKERSVSVWLLLVVFGSFCLMAIILGAVIGYGLIGDGAPLDALRYDTWRHIFDLVTENK